MKNIYGYICPISFEFIDTGLTELGAKIAARRAGAKMVGYRSRINGMYIPTKELGTHSNKWENV